MVNLLDLAAQKKPKKTPKGESAKVLLPVIEPPASGVVPGSLRADRKPVKSTPSEPKKATATTKAPTPPTINLEEDSEAPAANISDAVALALDCRHLEGEIELIEKKLKEKKEQLRKKQDEQLPELMSSLNLKKFSLDDGTEIEIKPFYSASIPTLAQIEKIKDPLEKQATLNRRNTCLDWLRKNGAEALIKSEVSVVFQKGQEKIAMQFKKDCLTSGYAADLEVGVNAASLTAFIREKIEAGIAVPEEPFKLFVGKQAKFKEPKKK